MIIIEAHDTQFEDAVQGTLAAKVGHKQDAVKIEYEYQAEKWLAAQGEEGSFVRAYFLRNDEPLAAWRNDGGGVFRCIGYQPHYGGAERTETPYIYPDAMLIASARLGHNALTPDLKEEWAREQLVGAVATAILLDEQGIVAAWERGEEAGSPPVLVARGPQREAPI